MVLAVLWLMDTAARASNYRELMASYNEATMHRVLKEYERARCGREVARAVYGDTAYWFYYVRGYRWWHLLPDHTFTKHSPFLRLSFYRGALFG